MDDNGSESAKHMGFTYAVNGIEARQLAVLKIQGSLDMDDRKEFLEALAQLHACDFPKLVVDLTGLTAISSLFIGSLVDFSGKAGSAGRTVAIMVRPALQKVCETIGLNKVAQLVEIT